MDETMIEEAMPHCVIIDSRSPLSFAGGHIRGSYNIWMNGLSRFAGWIIEYDKDILLVTEGGENVETARRYLTGSGLTAYEDICAEVSRMAESRIAS